MTSLSNSLGRVTDLNEGDQFNSTRRSSVRGTESNGIDGRREKVMELLGEGIGSEEEEMVRGEEVWQDRIDDILRTLYNDTKGDKLLAAASFRGLRNLAFTTLNSNLNLNNSNSSEVSWVITEEVYQLLLLWYDKVTFINRADLLNFLWVTTTSTSSTDHLDNDLMELVNQAIWKFLPPPLSALGHHNSIELLISAIQLGIKLHTKPENFITSIQEVILSCLDSQSELPSNWQGRAMMSLTSILTRFSPQFASEAIPLLITGINHSEQEWIRITRYHLLFSIFGDTTIELILGGIDLSILTQFPKSDQDKLMRVFLVSLSRLSDSEGLWLEWISTILNYSESQLSHGHAAVRGGLTCLELLLHRNLTPKWDHYLSESPALGRITSFVIQLGHLGHHVAFYQHRCYDALDSYLALVGRYAPDDVSLSAHFEQLIAAGGYHLLTTSDVLPRLAARFPNGSYTSFLTDPSPLLNGMFALGDQLNTKFKYLTMDDMGIESEVEVTSPTGPSVVPIRLTLALPEGQTFNLAPELYPAPTPTQFWSLWRRYPTRYHRTFSSIITPSSTPPRPPLRVATVHIDTTSHPQWSGYTYDPTSHRLILLRYRHHPQSHHQPHPHSDLTIRSDRPPTPALLLALGHFFTNLPTFLNPTSEPTPTTIPPPPPTQS